MYTDLNNDILHASFFNVFKTIQNLHGDCLLSLILYQVPVLIGD